MFTVCYKTSVTATGEIKATYLLTCYRSLLYHVQIEASIMKQRVLHELREAWNKLLHWELPTIDDFHPRPVAKTPARHTSTSTLNLTGVAAGAEVHRRSASGVAAASSKLGTLGGDVSRLCDRLLSRFVRRVTRDPTAQVHVVESPHARTASIATAATPPSPAPPAPDPSQVFDKLEQIFRFIGGALASVKLSDEIDSPAEVPTVPPRSDSLAGKLGEELMDRMFDCVYTDCLSHIAQSSTTPWPTLDKISQLAERFQTNISRHLQLQVHYYSLSTLHITLCEYV